MNSEGFISPCHGVPLTLDAKPGAGRSLEGGLVSGPVPLQGPKPGRDAGFLVWPQQPEVSGAKRPQGELSGATRHRDRGMSRNHTPRQTEGLRTTRKLGSPNQSCKGGYN